MTFLQNLEWRYATKKFDGKKIPADALATIEEAIRMAPTSFGLQPFHVTVVEDEALKQAIKPQAMNQEQITTCSHLLVWGVGLDMDKRIEDYLALRASVNGKAIDEKDVAFGAMLKNFAKQGGVEWATRQAYISLGFAMAACAELGIDSCPMEGFDPAGVKNAMQLAENQYPKVMLAVGYRASDDVPHKKVRFSKERLFDTK